MDDGLIVKIYVIMGLLVMVCEVDIDKHVMPNVEH